MKGYKHVLSIQIDPKLNEELDELVIPKIIGRSQLVEWALIKFVNDIKAGKINLPGAQLAAQRQAADSSGPNSNNQPNAIPMESGGRRSC